MLDGAWGSGEKPGKKKNLEEVPYPRMGFRPHRRRCVVVREMMEVQVSLCQWAGAQKKLSNHCGQETWSRWWVPRSQEVEGLQGLPLPVAGAEQY